MSRQIQEISVIMSCHIHRYRVISGILIISSNEAVRNLNRICQYGRICRLLLVIRLLIIRIRGNESGVIINCWRRRATGCIIARNAKECRVIDIRQGSSLLLNNFLHVFGTADMCVKIRHQSGFP